MKALLREILLKFPIWTFIEKSLAILNSLLSTNGKRMAYQVYELSADRTHNQHYPKRQEKMAILIQGPISHPNFLNQTINFYKTQFPGIPVYLSTWSADPHLDRFHDNKNVRLVLGDLPADSGLSNINYQAHSSVNGLEVILSDGYQFAVKCRTDQAMYANRSLELLLFLWKSAKRIAFQRIVTTDFNSFLFRKYSPNDQFMFGLTETLFDFWNSYKLLQNQSDVSIDNSLAERKVLRTYMKFLGLTFSDTLSQSLQLYRDLYIFIDNEDLDLFWVKGSQRTLRSRFAQQNYPSAESFVRYLDWVRLQTDIDSFLRDAELLKLQ